MGPLAAPRTPPHPPSRVPPNWPSLTIEYRHGKSVYGITVEDPGLVTVDRSVVILDGEELGTPEIPLRDDGERHEVNVRPGERAEAADSGVPGLHSSGPSTQLPPE